MLLGVSGVGAEGGMGDLLRLVEEGNDLRQKGSSFSPIQPVLVKWQSPLATENAAISDTLPAEVLATRKAVLRVRSLMGQVAMAQREAV